MLLKEKLNGITESDIQQFYDLLDSGETKEAFDFIATKFKSAYPNQWNHINSANKENNYLADILISLVDRGFNPEANLLLKLALDSRNNLDIPRDVIQLIATCLYNGTLRGNIPEWVYDASVYSGSSGNDLIYKIKALIFLSSNEAASYGTNISGAINEVKKLNKEIDIRRFLQNWQTPSNTSRPNYQTPRQFRVVRRS